MSSGEQVFLLTKINEMFAQNNKINYIRNFWVQVFHKIENEKDLKITFLSLFFYSFIVPACNAPCPSPDVVSFSTSGVRVSIIFAQARFSDLTGNIHLNGGKWFVLLPTRTLFFLNYK